MTPLAERIARLIAATGPISVAEYMALCLYDPEHGYYATREPFGAEGDFTTAPEISQMFGELVAVCLYSTWRAIGGPAPLTVAEIGPGRGALMKDMLRAWAKIAPDMLDEAAIVMIETSPRLAAVQKRTLAGAPVAPSWAAKVEDLPDGPLLIVGNEIFDALPVRQYVKHGGRWRERVVAIDENGGLAFRVGPGSLDPALLPAQADEAAEGCVAELSPARAALMDAVASRIARFGGAGLFIDYGHAEPGLGDTLQALYRHAYDDVFAHPGEADLTAHVDFAALAQAARAHGLAASVTTQGGFLLGLGLRERADRLGAGGGEELRARLLSEVVRLAGDRQMGQLFKVLAITPAGTTGFPF